MKEWVSKLLEVLFAFGFAFAVVILADRKLCRKAPEIVVETKVDTLVLHDTIVAVKPQYVTVRVKDTIRVPVQLDEFVGEVQDSVTYIPMVIQQKVYEDSTYRAVVSGPSISTYGPSLDTISVFRKTVFIDKEVTKTVYVEPSRWGIGVSAGYGLSKGGLSPYIGVGVQYSIWSPKKRR